MRSVMSSDHIRSHPLMDPLTGTLSLPTFNQLHNTSLTIMFYLILFPILLSSSLSPPSFPPSLSFPLPLSSFLSPFAPPYFPISPRHSETGHARGRRVFHNGGPHRLDGTYSTVQYNAAQYGTPSLRVTPLLPTFTAALYSRSLLPHNLLLEVPLLLSPFPSLASSPSNLSPWQYHFQTLPLLLFLSFPPWRSSFPPYWPQTDPNPQISLLLQKSRFLMYYNPFPCSSLPPPLLSSPPPFLNSPLLFPSIPFPSPPSFPLPFVSPNLSPWTLL
jgi:hypothetical protein